MRQLENFYHIVFIITAITTLEIYYENSSIKSSFSSDFLTKKGFTISLTGKPHSKVPMDQVIEMTSNISSKQTGGLTGKTENPRAFARWTKMNHFLDALREHQSKTL